MKKSLIVTIVLCGVILVWLVMIGRRVFEKPGSPSHLERIALQINERSPKKTGDAMEMTSAQAGDRRLTVQYRLLALPAAEVDAVTLREMREQLRRYSCDTESMRELLENGVTMHYVIHGSDGAQVTSTEVLLWECKL
jgi:hypothetical protein